MLTFSVTKLKEEAELLSPQEAHCIISRHKIAVFILNSEIVF